MRWHETKEDLAGRVPLSWLPTSRALEGGVRGSVGAGGGAGANSKKSRCGQCGTVARGYYDKRTRRIRDLSCGDVRIYLEVEVRRVRCRKCGKVKTERLDWLADNPLYTKRFYRHVGRKCRTMSIKDVAAELHLDWHAVKELDKRYMQEQLRRAPKPAPAVVGIDEIAIRRGFTYRLVATDLIRRRAIWFGGVDRSEASLDTFWAWLGARQAARVRLVVMDMWRAFENSTRRNAPQAAILYDKFHVVSCLGEALDEVRKQEYARLAGRDRFGTGVVPDGTPRHGLSIL